MRDHPLPCHRDQADFGILAEDEDFLAADKPAGLLVHPTKPGGPRTLWDGLRDLLGYELCNGGQVSIVNRLDRETSGVVVVAKNASAARIAGLAMEARAVRKRYLALVFGHPEWERQTVDAPIARLGEFAPSPVHLLRAVHPRGDPAVTEFRTRCRGEFCGQPCALVEAMPQTGRTHQIRVHLAHVGHPVVGDKLYARSPQLYLDFIREGWTPGLEGRLLLSRHALHCAEMALCGRCFSSPWPADFPEGMKPGEGVTPAPRGV